jgi:hypothetical protein
MTGGVAAKLAGPNGTRPAGTGGTFFAASMARCAEAAAETADAIAGFSIFSVKRP